MAAPARRRFGLALALLLAGAGVHALAATPTTAADPYQPTPADSPIDTTVVLDQLQRQNEQVLRLQTAIERRTTKPRSDPYSLQAGRPGLQIVPDANLATYYPVGTDIEYLVVTVPDPRVPRFKRSFDQVLDAINRAFAIDNFLFDRHYFPWGEPGADYGGLPDAGEVAVMDACRRFLHPNAVCTAAAPRPCSPLQGPVSRQGAIEQTVDTLTAFCTGERSLVRSDWTALNQVLGWTGAVPACPAAGVCADADTKPVLDLFAERLSAGPAAQLSLPSLSSDYGIITFRKDRWRAPVPRRECSPLSVFALYLVADRPSHGVQPDALLGALDQVLHHRRTGNLAVGRLTKESRHCAGITDRGVAMDEPLTMIGPSYSGSVGSLLAPLERLEHLHPGVRVDIVSPTATARTNPEIKHQRDNVRWWFRAPNDLWKSQRLLDLITDRLGLAGDDVVVFAENSTWGTGFANTLKRSVTPAIKRAVYFPPNLWETRIDAGEQRDAGKPAGAAPDLRALLRSGRELRLDADIGSEHPPSYSQHVSARTAELQLDAAIRDLQERATRMIVLVATDVRDQLFLARRLRAALPSVQLLVPESDVLLSHPDYLDATRGMLVFSSAPLRQRDSDDDFRFAKDEAAMHYRTLRWVTGLDSPVRANPCVDKPSGRAGCLYVVTRHGLAPLDESQREHGPANHPLLALLLFPIALILWPLLPRAGVQRDRALGPVTWLIGLDRNQTADTRRSCALYQHLAVLAAILLSAALVDIVTTHAAPFGGIAPELVIVLVISASVYAVLTVKLRLRNRSAQTRTMQSISADTPLAAPDDGWWLFCGLAVVLLLVFGGPVWNFVLATTSWTANAASLGMVALTWLGLCFTIAAYRSIRYVLALCDWLFAGIGETPAALSAVGKSWLPAVVTPFLAQPDPLPDRLAIYERGEWRASAMRRLLALEIQLLRSRLFAAFLMPLFGIAAVWLSPVASQNALLALCLLSLVATVWVFTRALLILEGDNRLLKLFCARERSQLFKPQLLVLIMIPVTVLALAIWSTFNPGMRAWTDGFVMPIIGRWLG